MELNTKENDPQNLADNENYYKVVKPLRTYERDVSESVREKKPSQISINLEEKRKRKSEIQESNEKIESESQENYGNVSKNSSVKKIFIIFFLFLIIIGGIIVLPKIWSIYMTPNNTETPIVKTETIINGDGIKKIDVAGKTRAEIIDLINQYFVGLPANNLGKLEIINLVEIIGGTETVLTGERFLRLMTESAPQPLLRALGPKITFGYAVNAEEHVPFLILEVSSFENAYNQMLSWERSIMSSLGLLISRVNENQSNKFEDRIIKNKDTRILRDSLGEIILIYSFLDNQTLLLTTNREAFEEILGKLLLTQ